MPPPVLTRLSNWSSSASRSTEGSDVTGLCPLSSARVPTATPVIRKYRDTQRRQHFLQVLVEQRVAQRLRGGVPGIAPELILLRVRHVAYSCEAHGCRGLEDDCRSTGALVRAGRIGSDTQMLDRKSVGWGKSGAGR